MPQVINTNLASVNAQRNLNRTQNDLSTALQRLSSGLRINSAKDDAAGLAISNRFQTQVRGLTVAIRNANDGISLAQTTEGALAEVTDAMQRMRDLAVQSINDSNSVQDRQSLQDEIDQLVSEIDRISRSTTFNGRNVLDGSTGSLTFQIGADVGQTVAVSGVDVRATSLGSQPGVVQSQGSRVALLNNGGPAEAGTAGIQEDAGAYATAALALDDLDISIDGLPNAIDVALAQYGGTINSATVATLTNSTAAGYGGGMAKDIAARINSVREAGDLPNVYASAVTTFRGSDVAAADYTGTVAGGGNNSVSQGSLLNGDLTINGIDIPPVSFLSNDSDGSLVTAINSKSDITGVTAEVDNNGELVLTANDGRDIIVTTADAATNNELFGGGTAEFSAGFASLRVTGSLVVSADNTISFANGGNAGGDAVAGVATLTADNVQAQGTIAQADITTVAGANRLIEAVDSALGQVDAIRSELGAIQNRMESTIRNLSNVRESLSAANSRILDADFAEETARLTKTQVLQQAGISVLSQANSIPQQVLTLLQ